MKKLKIEYKGGYNQVSNYLIREHDASFAVIVDALVNIYNMNIDNLVKTDGENSVKISNGYLSRNTGLGLSIVKSNIEKIENIGLVRATKKGKGNTRHYVIYIDRINTYIKALKGKFNQWYNDSIESSKKEKSRSEEADKIKLEASFKTFENTMEMLTSKANKKATRLVENRLTNTSKTYQPNRLKPTVVDIKEKTTIKTTTKRNNVVVDEIFDQTNSKGMFIKIEAYDKIVYKKDYEDFIAKHTKEDLELKFEEFEQQEFEDSLVIEDGYDFDDDDKNEATEAIKKHPITNDRSMMYIYDLIKKISVKKNKEAKRIFENTKEPASPETSKVNWKRLEDAYFALPPIKNQGQFLPSKKDEIDFFKLSEFRQEWVVAEVKTKKNETTTASRPTTYIGKAMKNKLSTLKKPNTILNVAL